MHYSYSYYADSEEGMLAAILVSVLSAVFSGGVGVLLYAFRSIGVYSIAKRRGLKHPWFAWVPVVDNYLLGSLSDQYQYVVKGRNKNKRKWLLGFSIALAVLYVIFGVLLTGTIVTFVGNMMAGFSSAKLEQMGVRAVLSLLASCIPLVCVAIAMCVIRYIALYDVYASLEPQNSVMYIVLSVVFRITEPFFLFFNRKKDDGMPPRREEPKVEQPVWETPKEEPWVNE